MPQEFHVLQCHKCQTFQVHQVKKTNKWNCKLCGEKESVIKVFGRGSGADCRHHVQRLNQLRGDIISVKEQINTFSYQTQDESDSSDKLENDSYNRVQETGTDSKWIKFLSTPEVNDTNSEDNNEKFTTDKETNLAAKKMKVNRKRKRNESMQSSFCKRKNGATIEDYHENSDYGVTLCPTNLSQLKTYGMLDEKENNGPCISIQSNGFKKEQKTISKWEQYVDDEESSSTEENSEKICNKEFDSRYQNYENDIVENIQLDGIASTSSEKRENKAPESFVNKSRINMISTLDRSAQSNNSEINITRKCEIPSKHENKNIVVGLNVSKQSTLCQDTTKNLSVKSASIFYTGDITEADLDFDI